MNDEMINTFVFLWGTLIVLLGVIIILHLFGWDEY